MAVYKVTIDERNIAGKRFLELMKTLPFISITENKKMNDLDEALKDIEDGRISNIMTFEEFKAHTQKIQDKA